MAADDGHNAMCRVFRCPGRSFFERADFSELTWCFPPRDMIGLVLILGVEAQSESAHAPGPSHPGIDTRPLVASPQELQAIDQIQSPV